MCVSSKHVITAFRGAYAFLSNFYESPMTFHGVTYQSAKAAFQAQKCLTEVEKQGFAELTPIKAKRRGRQVMLRSDWDEVKLDIMEKIVRAKFIQNETLKALLLATGDAELKEGNTWNDMFWGIDSETGNGQNHLGKILMKVRDEVLNKYQGECI